MNTARGGWVAVLGGVLCCGCGPFPTGPSEVLTGTWIARGTGHSSGFVMSLQQTGDTITGLACGVDSGVTLFTRAPVQGDYPHVRFVVTQAAADACCPHLEGVAFSGKIDGTRDIVGTLGGSGRLGSYDLRFERSISSTCE